MWTALLATAVMIAFLLGGSLTAECLCRRAKARDDEPRRYDRRFRQNSSQNSKRLSRKGDSLSTNRTSI